MMQVTFLRSFRMLGDIALVATILAASMSTASAQKVNGNAALIYWQAFDGIPDVNGDMYAEAMKTPSGQGLESDITRKITSASHSLRLLERANQRTYCDWGVDFQEDGAETILPHLAPARGLARLGLLRARQRFSEGRHEAAVNDVLSVMTLARHAGRDRSLVGMLVGHAIQRMGHDVTAIYLPELPKGALEHLEAGLAQLPARNSFAQCMVTEAEFAPWLVRRVKATRNDSELLELCGSLGGSTPADDFITQSGGRQGIIDHASKLISLYDSLPGMVHRPTQVETARFASVVKTASQNPVGKLFFPALDKAWHAHRRSVCEEAMLQAAIGVVRRGEGTLAQLRDPTNGKEFKLVRQEPGFELQSELKVRHGGDEMLRLRVGSTQQD